MPILTGPTDNILELMEKLLAAKRRVVTVGVETEDAGFAVAAHSHRRAQLMLSLHGVGLCEAAGGIWLIPPQSAIFVPAGTKHRITVAGRVEGYAVFIKPEDGKGLSTTCTTVTVNPLLRELIIRSAQFTNKLKQRQVEAHITALIIDELHRAPTGGLHLPLPSDERLRSIAQIMMAQPSERGTIRSWARRIGLSQRTLSRMISEQTGMSFGRWRQQLHLILATQWMAAGVSVQQAATDLGYESSGSFVTMFRKALGTTPGRYIAGHPAERLFGKNAE